MRPRHRYVDAGCYLVDGDAAGAAEYTHRVSFTAPAPGTLTVQMYHAQAPVQTPAEETEIEIVVKLEVVDVHGAQSKLCCQTDGCFGDAIGGPFLGDIGDHDGIGPGADVCRRSRGRFVAIDQKEVGALMRKDASHRAAIALRIAAGLARAEDRDPFARQTSAHANSGRKGSSATSGSGSTPAVSRNMQTCEYCPTVQTMSIAV